MNLVMKADPDARIVSVMMLVRAGSINETDSTRGVSRLVERSLFRISNKCSDIQWEIDSYGGSYQSSTNQDFVFFSVNVDRSYLENILNIFSDVIQYTELPDSLLCETRQSLMKDIKNEQSNPLVQNLSLFLKNAFRIHPYRFLPSGNLETVENLKPNDVRSYYGDLYTPENITLVICGGFNPKTAQRLLKNNLSTFSRVSKHTFRWDPEPDQTVPREITHVHSFSKGIALITIGWKAPSIRNPDTYGMDIILSSLAIGQSGRLITQIKEQMSSVYFIQAQYRTPREPGFFYINVACDPAAVSSVKDKILKEIDILRKDSITPKELDRAKMFFKSTDAYNQESTFETAFYLGFWSVMENVKFSQTYLPNIQRVTLSDVQRIASEYFREDNYTLVISLPDE
jgi:predicted Zn-dependent peptidase